MLLHLLGQRCSNCAPGSPSGTVRSRSTLWGPWPLHSCSPCQLTCVIGFQMSSHWKKGCQGPKEFENPQVHPDVSFFCQGQSSPRIMRQITRGHRATWQPLYFLGDPLYRLFLTDFSTPVLKIGEYSSLF